MNYKDLPCSVCKIMIEITDYKTDNITANIVKEFRQLTGEGVMVSKRALKKCHGNFKDVYKLLFDTCSFGTIGAQ